jgi:hypothetical protein
MKTNEDISQAEFALADQLEQRLAGRFVLADRLEIRLAQAWARSQAHPLPLRPRLRRQTGPAKTHG